MSGNEETEDFKALFDRGIVFHAMKNEENCTNGDKHDWQGWRDFEDGRGGETVCARCGMGAMSHSLRYGSMTSQTHPPHSHTCLKAMEGQE